LTDTLISLNITGINVIKTLKRFVPDSIKKTLKDLVIQKRNTTVPLEQVTICPCCGSTSLSESPTLWEKLIQDWQLSDFEVAYINRQQGVNCKRCKVNLRGMAIAYGMMQYANYKGYFKDFVRTRKMHSKKILEINEAAWLTPYFNKIPGHVLANFPEVDMQNMRYPANSFDIVVHSDTLEHVPDPLAGLRECYRVLVPGGYCVFTVPMVIDRLTRSRAGLPPSYHGSENKNSDDYIVQTEFGGDAWKYPILAGFSEVRIFSLEYPSSESLLCKK